MSVKKILLFFCIALFSMKQSKAQFDAHFSNYFALHSLYNPACSGKQDKLNVYAAYNMQLAGFKNAPSTMYAGADIPFKFLNRKHGAGVGLYSDNIGLFSNQRIWLQYAYRTKLFNGNFSLGLQIGAVNISFDPSGIDLGENIDAANDPAFPTTKVNGVSLDAGFGAFYSHPLFYAGISATHLSAPMVSLGESNEMKIDPIIYFTSGCNIKTHNPLISVQPSLLLKTDLLSYKFDLTGRVFYKKGDKTFYGGLSYSPSTSVSFLAGVHMGKIKAGYAYEMYTSKVGIGNGSHDIYISYTIDMNFVNRGKNKHKSIRIL
jgi:type IX secretion system PorP/SprF family membrane protein